VRVAVLAGGRSSEHEVSLNSAAAIEAGLRSAGHTVDVISLERDGRWHHQGRQIALRPGGGIMGADAVWPALHGAYGEDGTVQGLLELLDVPYVGAGVLASALCMDKVVFKDVLAGTSVPQVRYLALREGDGLDAVDALGYPVFVKPARAGSSKGIAKVSSHDELPAAVDAAFAIDNVLIVEALATGMEVECAVLGHGASAEASVPGEIVLPEADWYDYEAKYSEGGMELVVPARISASATARVQSLAVETFTRAGCSGLARVDFFVDGEDVLVNEINTMPGFTEFSVYPKLWEASGVAFGELCDRLVQIALQRHAERPAG
jgi:D-alanine-D-alanine ligase